MSASTSRVCSPPTPWGTAKPHRETFDRAAEALGSVGSGLTYVGDDLALDVPAARAAGWRTFHLDRFGTSCVQDCIRLLSEFPVLLRRRCEEAVDAHLSMAWPTTPRSVVPDGASPPPSNPGRDRSWRTLRR
ncbi:HAD family hydrolase [Actinomyces gerencseriae]|uniref:HAD family hydrolase n=1 Tax=Actinomyces gerencseriae TaxID=52769 RepID=UPI003CCC189E